jgi:hypothetical protein
MIAGVKVLRCFVNCNQTPEPLPALLLIPTFNEYYTVLLRMKDETVRFERRLQKTMRGLYGQEKK